MTGVMSSQEHRASSITSKRMFLRQVVALKDSALGVVAALLSDEIGARA